MVRRIRSHLIDVHPPMRVHMSDIRSYAYNISRQQFNLHNGRLRARGESVRQTALATILAVFVEGHLQSSIN